LPVHLTLAFDHDQKFASAGAMVAPRLVDFEPRGCEMLAGNEPFP
jgi:hypothetical protein